MNQPTSTPEQPPHPTSSDKREGAAADQSAFGRLTALASLLDRRTGLYRNALTQHLPEDYDHNGLVAQAHRAAFSSWLNMAISEQLRDLCAFLDTAKNPYDPNSLRALWAERELDHLVPPESCLFEREFFLSQVLIVIELAIAHWGCAL